MSRGCPLTREQTLMLEQPRQGQRRVAVAVVLYRTPLHRTLLHRTHSCFSAAKSFELHWQPPNRHITRAAACVSVSVSVCTYQHSSALCRHVFRAATEVKARRV